MATTVEYGTYIIDLCSAMLDHPRGLTKPQGQRVVATRKQIVGFLTEYLRHESSSLPDLLEYLSTEATPPLERVSRYCDDILEGHCGPVQPDYGEAIVEIRDCCHAMYDDMEDMCQNLQQLMGDLGI